MRDRSGWHQRLTPKLNAVWPADPGISPGLFLDVELGLFLLQQVMPTRAAADAYTLFGGYPYAEAFGDGRSETHRLMVRRARHYLWDMRRRRQWNRAVEAYMTLPQELRGYDLTSLDDVPQQRSPSHASDRFTCYGDLLSQPPAFARKRLPIAGEGEHRFPVGDRHHSVVFPPGLLSDEEPSGHDLNALPAHQGAAITAPWAELKEAAAEMDALESALPERLRNDWADRLDRVELMIRDEDQQAFIEGDVLEIRGLLNLVGMVGAGKSTLRDILTYWAVTRHPGLRVTILVGDVPEELAIHGTFRRLGVSAAPILGHSTRERHIERLHRRLATAGAPSMLAHRHDGFAHLSSACPLDALRGLNIDRPLRVNQAPCTSLHPVAPPDPDDDLTVTGSLIRALGGPDTSRRRDTPRSGGKQQRHGCPLWADCPRHAAARDLVSAQIWVANPASLVHSGVPAHLHTEQLRYLELACRTSDLIIVDEADRVQAQLDTAFAPSATLSGGAAESWLDEVARHKIGELAQRARLQLSETDVAAWNKAFNTVTTATDMLYTMLVGNEPLREWITEDYFSALTLHQWLINTWFPDLKTTARQSTPPHTEPGGTEPDGTGVGLDERRAQRDRISAILDRFRDDPLRQQQAWPDDPIADTVNRLVHLTLELLHTDDPSAARARLRELLLELIGDDPADSDPPIGGLDDQIIRFEFTLILTALHHRLNFLTMLWQRVEAALNLDSTSNVLSRRPPRDYEPIIPESPMGNVLGFQFRMGERDQDGGQSGELRFFRCNGIGRELLLRLNEIPTVDDRPGPNVVLMSATSWAGESTRFHVHVPVGALLRPRKEEVDAIRGTTFRTQFTFWPQADATEPRKAIRLSGSAPGLRDKALIEMLRQLAVPDRSLRGSVSEFDQELADIDDPDRRRILVLVGSYAEARRAADYLNTVPEWTGRVTQLIADDADLDDTWQTLRRGDIARFRGELLIAPLLAVERGHNIVLPGGKAAIGAVYFLARPHPRPDDMSLAILAINDWAVRQVRYGNFQQAALAAGSPDAAARDFRRRARKLWNHLLSRDVTWISLDEDEKRAFTWDQMVVIWQVIGRLVRGGVPARAIFVDAAFSPKEAGIDGTITPDTPATSLLHAMHAVLQPYFADSDHPGGATNGSTADPMNRSLVAALYEPLYRALDDMTSDLDTVFTTSR